MNLGTADSFLLRCVRAGLAGEPIDWDHTPYLDWDGLCDAAQQHQVQPLVYEAFKLGRDEDRLPEAVRTRLLLNYYPTGMRNAFVQEQLAVILRAVTASGVDVMLLKGAVLAFQDYSRPEHRGLGDVDLLVREHQFETLLEALTSLGYCGSIPNVPCCDLPRYAHSVRQLRFSSGRPPRLEVHLRVLNAGVAVAAEPAWDDAKPCVVGGVRVLRPSNERFLLHLCLHAQQHAFSLLRLFVDIAVWFRARKIDPERFLFLARHHHLATTAHYALAYTDRLLGLPEGESIRERLRPAMWKRRLFEALWHDREVRSLSAQRGPQEAELARAYLLGEAPMRHKARFLWQILMPPRAWLTSDPSEHRSRSRRLARACRLAWRGLTEI